MGLDPRTPESSYRPSDVTTAGSYNTVVNVNFHTKTCQEGDKKRGGFFMDSVQACKNPIYVPEMTTCVIQSKYVYCILNCLCAEPAFNLGSSL